MSAFYPEIVEEIEADEDVHGGAAVVYVALAMVFPSCVSLCSFSLSHHDVLETFKGVR